MQSYRQEGLVPSWTPRQAHANLERGPSSKNGSSDN